MTLERFSWGAAAGGVAFALLVASRGTVLVTTAFLALLLAGAWLEDWIRGRLEGEGRRSCRRRSARRRARDSAALKASLRVSGAETRPGS